ncbi:MAG: DUF2878 domain-containing protein [Gammaproteobacteria bacterium]
MLMPNLINFILFQIGWFACVLSSAAGHPSLGALIAGAIIAWHVWQARRPSQEISLILVAMLIGMLWDSLLVWQSLLDYHSGILATNTAPYWIVIMWALFATTLNLSLGWLKQHLLLASLLGAIAGPLAYYAGARLGALSVPQPLPAYLALAIGWAVFTPILSRLSRRLNGYANRLTGEWA